MGAAKFSERRMSRWKRVTTSHHQNPGNNCVGREEERQREEERGGEKREGQRRGEGTGGKRRKGRGNTWFLRGRGKYTLKRGLRRAAESQFLPI